jgi:hypothetical protein
MTRGGVKEYLEAVRERYLKASRREKGQILDEAVMVTGYHRKAAIRLLRCGRKAKAVERRGRTKRYGVEAASALKAVWEASDRMCSKRLQPFLPELVAALERHGELAVPEAVKEQLCRMSVSTIDRALRPHRLRGQRRPFSTTKPGSLLKAAIPIRTFADWDDKRPGFLEIDLVAHCGESTEGFYLNTLSTVDVATGWVECRGVWGKGQQRVGGAIHEISKRLPFPLLGLDSDNGSEFINHHLYDYCQRKEITFTRSRPYKKNDAAHVEQKNWSVVRRLVGYERYNSEEALAQLDQVYRLVRGYVNFFQPLMQLQRKSRHGAKVYKVYDSFKTPYRRLLASRVLTREQEEALAAQYERLNPVRLLSQINQALETLWGMADTTSKHRSPVTFSSQATKAFR